MTTATKTERRFYIARNPDVSHADVLLAKAAPYDRIETAYQDMGGGVIFDETGAIVAFHERHATILEHRGLLGRSPRMTNFLGGDAVTAQGADREASLRWPTPHPGARNLSSGARSAFSEKVALIDRVVRDLNERSTYHRTDADTALMSLVYDDDIDAQITVREFVELVLHHAEQGRRLASEREDLIARGVDPSLLEVPLHPDNA